MEKKVIKIVIILKLPSVLSWWDQLQYLTNQFQFFLAQLTTIGLKSIHKKFLEIQYISYDQFCALLFEWLPRYM